MGVRRGDEWREVPSEEEEEWRDDVENERDSIVDVVE